MKGADGVSNLRNSMIICELGSSGTICGYSLPCDAEIWACVRNNNKWVNVRALKIVGK